MPAGPGGATACTYTYSDWGVCQSDSTQLRTMLTSTPSGCTGTPVLSQACTYVPPTPSACTYNYSGWGACQSNNTQTRTATSSPAGCTGTPVCHRLAPMCRRSRPAPRSTYSAWGAASLTTRRPGPWLHRSPAAAPDDRRASPVTGLHSTCTSFTYSAWGTCQSNSTQTRTVSTSSPTGCTGGTPVVSQSCTYVPPIDGAALYTQYCSGCHGNGKKGKSVSAIQSAISSNRGGMGSLSSLTLEQITAISTAP